jgi:t-SNARE complex subunit (syntaxin)
VNTFFFKLRVIEREYLKLSNSSHVPVHAPAVRNIEEAIFAMMEQSQAVERARYADREMCCCHHICIYILIVIITYIQLSLNK